jgi:cytochrome P450
MPGAPYYDPYDYEIDANAHAVWKRLRDEAPLYRNDRHDFWALSRFHDVLEASVDVETFSSAEGTVLDLIGQIQAPYPMIFRDPPEHTQLRKLVSRAFSPRRIADLEAQVRAIAARYLDRHVGSGGFDYVDDFGANLPMMVIGAMLGVPEADHDQIRHWSDEALHREPGETEADAGKRVVETRRKLFGYFAKYLQERRASPRDDMMTDLIEAELRLDDGSTRRLTDLELLVFINLLSAAGNETVARLLGWTGATLARFPAERRRLVDDPSLVPNAVEELLRYEAPSPVQARVVTRDVVRHGQTVPAGAKMLLLTGSAGRDEREYADPDRFDVGRKLERHVTFGYGIHFCLGASLARLEGRVAIEETLRRFPEWDVDWARAEMVHTSTVRGYARLPVTF